MPRGPHPADAALFAPKQVARVRAAVHELSWLLGRGYAELAALELVGNKHQLTKRQRIAVRRSSCAEGPLRERQRREVQELDGRVLVDGFNLLICVERAMAGAPILVGVDGALRDLAGIHGTYRLVADTPAAIQAIARQFDGVDVHWLLDRPVSNSGRLAAALREAADWSVEVHDRPDAVLRAHAGTVVTGDGPILQNAGSWFNMHRWVIEREVPDAWLIDLRP